MFLSRLPKKRQIAQPVSQKLSIFLEAVPTKFKKHKDSKLLQGLSVLLRLSGEFWYFVFFLDCFEEWVIILLVLFFYCRCSFRMYVCLLQHAQIQRYVRIVQSKAIPT